MNKAQPELPALRISILAVLTAMTAVFTFTVRIPIAPTRGYINLGDVLIYFTAFSFGPYTAMISAGLGTALADLISGYAQWAPISLFIHGLQGLVVGLIAAAGARSHPPVQEKTKVRLGIFWGLAAVAGTLLMCAGYLAAGSVMVGLGAALVELPGNLIQNLVGVLVGIPLVLTVRKAYPPIAKMGW